MPKQQQIRIFEIQQETQELQQNDFEVEYLETEDTFVNHTYRVAYKGDIYIGSNCFYVKQKDIKKHIKNIKLFPKWK